jgi:NTP pyrophosphatase (non-canonical NTP hydrolase)
MEKLKKIVNYYGFEIQILKAIEELTELSLSLQHFRSNKESHENVISEIADVIVMTKQLRLMFGDGLVDEEVGRKLDRTIERIEKRKA